MDFELEMGVFVGGKSNKLGERITAKDAEEHLFGFVLLNDWSGKTLLVVLPSLVGRSSSLPN